MGTLVDKKQVEIAKQNIAKIGKRAQIVYGDLEPGNALGADFSKGAFFKPIVLREDHPFANEAVHTVEVFGPVVTLMPYSGLEEAITLTKMGKGSLVSTIVTNRDEIAKEYAIKAASYHGRILILNKESARQSTGHGSPLPTLVHGGPGRAGGGEEMGGLRGIKHYMQRCALQGSPSTLTEITGIYQPRSRYKPTKAHPFTYYWEDIQPGMSLKTHSRTIANSDIRNFANLTWDHFYAHTDETALEGTIFKRLTAHGYFIISLAAGLFVYPNKGPVAANYGLEDIRFIRPLYDGDTVHVRLTCKEKRDRDQKGKVLPSGIVKWYVEVFDTNITQGNVPEDELGDKEALVAVATILTMVRKKQRVFKEIDEQLIDAALERLTPASKPKWGRMQPQQMLEHLELIYQMAAGDFQDFEIVTPLDALEETQAQLWNYEPFTKGAKNPLYKAHQDELPALIHRDLAEAKAGFKAARKRFLTHFKKYPETQTKHITFGYLTGFEWKLMERKHLNHHFSQFGLLEG